MATLLTSKLWPSLVLGMLSLLPFCGSLAFSRDAVEEDYKLVVDVDLVTVLVTVTTPEGSLITGLTKKDFQLFEDDVPQKITLFGRESDQPLRLQALFDSSLSIATELGTQQEAAIDFLKLVVSRKDRVSILQVSQDVVELVRESSRLEAMAKALRSIRPSGGTSLYDAVYLAAEGLALSRGRKVILIISDGADTTSGVSLQECLKRTLASEAVVYALVVQPIKSEPGRNLAGEHSMIYLTRETGGRFFKVPSHEALRESFARIEEELRTQYLLGYYPKHKGECGQFRKIWIAVDVPGAVVRARNGYYAATKTRCPPEPRKK